MCIFIKIKLFYFFCVISYFLVFIFTKLFTNDSLFWMTLKNTFVFSVLLVPLNLVLALLLALDLGDGGFGTRFTRTVIFLPVVTSGVAWAIVWKYLLQSGTAGPVNYFLSLLGIEGPNWLTDKNWAMISVVVNRVLKNLGTNVLIFYGAVMNMPQDVIEAARIDGLSEYGIWARIMLPLSKAAIATLVIFTFVGTWNDYMGPMIYLTRDINKTVQVGLRRFIQENSSDYHLIMAASLCSLLPVSIVFLCLQKYFIEGIATSGLKG